MPWGWLVNLQVLLGEVFGEYQTPDRSISGRGLDEGVVWVNDELTRVVENRQIVSGN